MGLPARVYLQALRLASLLGTGTSTGALLSASSTGGTSGTSAHFGALLTELVMSLLFLARDHGVLFRFTSRPRLASLAARCALPGAPAAGASRALALSVALSRAVALSPALFQPVLSTVLLLTGDPSSLEALLCCTLTGIYIPKNPKFPKKQTIVSRLKP